MTKKWLRDPIARVLLKDGRLFGEVITGVGDIGCTTWIWGRQRYKQPGECFRSVEHAKMYLELLCEE